MKGTRARQVSATHKVRKNNVKRKNLAKQNEPWTVRKERERAERAARASAFSGLYGMASLGPFLSPLVRYPDFDEAIARLGPKRAPEPR